MKRHVGANGERPAPVDERTPTRIWADSAMYVRFVATRQHPNTGVQMGIFQTDRLLAPQGQLPEWNEKRLAELEEWFAANLREPDRVARSRRPNGHHAAVSWFKSTATEHIARARELAALLEQCGVPTRMLTTDRPGYVVYEDEFQIVAEPFRSDHVDRGV